MDKIVVSVEEIHQINGEGWKSKSLLVYLSFELKLRERQKHVQGSAKTFICKFCYLRAEAENETVFL